MNKRLLAAILFPALILAASLGIKISAAAEADGGVSAAVTHSSTPGPEAPEKAKAMQNVYVSIPAGAGEM